MERRGWIVAIGALLLIGAGLWRFLTDADHADGVVDGPPAPARYGRSGEPIGSAPGRPGGGTSAAGVTGRRTAFADGGVVRVAPRPGAEGPTPAVRPSGVRLSGPRRGPSDEAQSSGWRLGQARRRISILEARAATYQEAVDRFVEEGRMDTAERQRGVLERVRRRLEGLREQEQELSQAAQADGTLGDVDTGYEEGEREPSRTRPVSARTR